MSLNARGFTLIETLVALVVLSVGLLGVMALLLGGLREQGLAFRQVVVSSLLADIAERLRIDTDLRERHGTPVSDAAAVQFAAVAALRLPYQSPEAVIDWAPAIGPATPDRMHISLRWREARDEHAIYESHLSVLAQWPVAG